MKSRSLLLLRISLGLLLVIWGLDKLVNVEYGLTYPLQLVINGATLLGVWKSILDPWGWYMKGGNALFYPSLIIFAGSLVLLAFRDEDRLVVGRRDAP